MRTWKFSNAKFDTSHDQKSKTQKDSESGDKVNQFSKRTCLKIPKTQIIIFGLPACLYFTALPVHRKISPPRSYTPGS